MEFDLSSRVQSFCERRWKPLLAVVVGLAVAVAWSCRWVNDDAFISFNYARALVRGEGLTWFGTRVEGYTNFLWVLWSALGMRLASEPMSWSYFGGLVALAVTLAATWDVARRLFDDVIFAFVTLVLVATNYTMLAFATSGLETMAQTAFIILALRETVILVRSEKPGALPCLAVSMLSAAALLTRMDSAVIIAVIGGAAFFNLVRRRASLGHFLALVLPVVIIMGVWEAWRISYYGKLLPNTFYAKVAADRVFNPNGIHFIARFLRRYLVWPFLGLGALALLVRRPEAPIKRLVLPVTAVFAWSAYLIWVGGDFMEFRFMVPALPLLMLVVAYALYFVIGRTVLKHGVAVSLAGIIILGAASYQHSRARHNFVSDYTLDAVPVLADFYGLYPEGDWSTVGSILKGALHGSGAVLACQAVGAIPYYSDLSTVDQWGLTDLVVPVSGIAAPASYRRPGHRRYASLAYLKERKVNFILGHPRAVSHGVLAEHFEQPLEDPELRYFLFSAVPFSKSLPVQVTLVEVPLDDQRSLLMWYLTPTAKIDAALAQTGWEVKTLNIPSEVTGK